MAIDGKLLDNIYRKKDEIVSREIAGETILVPIKGKLADMQRIFALEGVSEYIWRQLDGKKKLVDICMEVMDMYDVASERARQDAAEFINELIVAGLIETVS